MRSRREAAAAAVSETTAMAAATRFDVDELLEQFWKGANVVVRRSLPVLKMAGGVLGKQAGVISAALGVQDAWQKRKLVLSELQQGKGVWGKITGAFGALSGDEKEEEEEEGGAAPPMRKGTSGSGDGGGVGGRTKQQQQKEEFPYMTDMLSSYNNRPAAGSTSPATSTAEGNKKNGVVLRLDDLTADARLHLAAADGSGWMGPILDNRRLGPSGFGQMAKGLLRLSSSMDEVDKGESAAGRNTEESGARGRSRRQVPPELRGHFEPLLHRFSALEGNHGDTMAAFRYVLRARRQQQQEPQEEDFVLRGLTTVRKDLQAAMGYPERWDSECLL
jgi:hypothetical protein